jgi:hypothetical protein
MELTGHPLLCPELIGRTSELAALGLLVEQARGGHSHLALLEGEAEIGKSRLLPPGHDAWVVGDEPYVGLDFQGGHLYAKSPQ